MDLQQMILPILVVLALLELGLSIKIVDESERGRRTRWGRALPGVVMPGLRLAWFPIERIKTELVEPELLIADPGVYFDSTGGEWTIQPYVRAGIGADPHFAIFKGHGRKGTLEMLRKSLTRAPTLYLGRWSTDELQSDEVRHSIAEQFCREVAANAATMGIDVAEYGFQTFDPDGETAEALRKRFQAAQERARIVEMAHAEAERVRIEIEAEGEYYPLNTETDAMVAASEKGALIVIHRGGTGASRSDGGRRGRRRPALPQPGGTDDDDDTQTGLLALAAQRLKEIGGKKQ